MIDPFRTKGIPELPYSPKLWHWQNPVDLAIVCVGLDSTLEGEQGDVGNAFASGDKPDLLLPKIQRDLVEQVIATGTPVILIDLAGSPIDLSAYEDQVPAILHAWYPGGEGGRAIADILFGKVSPGGKLPPYLLL